MSDFSDSELVNLRLSNLGDFYRLRFQFSPEEATEIVPTLTVFHSLCLFDIRAFRQQAVTTRQKQKRCGHSTGENFFR